MPKGDKILSETRVLTLDSHKLLNMSHPGFLMIARMTSERSNIRKKRMIFLGRPQRGRISKVCSGIMCDLSEVDNAFSWPNAINI